MGTFMNTLARYESNGKAEALTAAAIRFTILTWCRSNETRFARWSEIEFPEIGDPIWRIPQERMKARREHIVPLSPQAVELLRQLPRNEPDDLIFWSGRSKSGALSENTLLYALYRMGYHSRATIHGFRRTASTWSNEQLAPGCDPAAPVRRYDRDWIEMALAHSDENNVRAAYNAGKYLIPRRAMLCQWADWLDAESDIASVLQ